MQYASKIIKMIYPYFFFSLTKSKTTGRFSSDCQAKTDFFFLFSHTRMHVYTSTHFSSVVFWEDSLRCVADKRCSWSPNGIFRRIELTLCFKLCSKILMYTYYWLFRNLNSLMRWG